MAFLPENMTDIPLIEGIDTRKAVETIGGNTDAYLDMLGGFKRDIPVKTKEIQNSLSLPDLKDFVVLVHGIKGAARMLGMADLGEEMYGLEMAGRKLDMVYISDHLDRVLADYGRFETLLKPYDARERTAEEKPADPGSLKEILNGLKADLEDFESEQAEEKLKELGKFSFSGEQKEIYERLCDAIDAIDYYASIDCVNKFLEVLEW